tara:strand:+ start:514 stop:882 length:369 start_codon:yes stop_codon:yes gene_type:complete
MAYASGTHSLARCDRCGFVYGYLELKKEWNNLRVCHECFEPKHPQLDPISHRVDPEALRDPRPTEPTPTLHLGKVIVSNPVDINGVSSPIMFAGNSNTIGTSYTITEVTASVGTVNIVTLSS